MKVRELFKELRSNIRQAALTDVQFKKKKKKRDIFYLSFSTENLEEFDVKTVLMDLSDTVHWLHGTVLSQSGNLFSLGYSHCQSLIKAAYCSVCALCLKHRCQGCSRLVFDFMCVFTCLKKEEKKTNKHRRLKVVRVLVFACAFWKNNWWIRFNQMEAKPSN